MSRRHRARSGSTIRDVWCVRMADNGALYDVAVVEHRESSRHWIVTTRGPLWIPRRDVLMDQPLLDHTGAVARHKTRALAGGAASQWIMAMGGRRHEGLWVVATNAPLPDWVGWERLDPYETPAWAPDFLEDLESEPSVGDELHWRH